MTENRNRSRTVHKVTDMAALCAVFLLSLINRYNASTHGSSLEHDELDTDTYSFQLSTQRVRKTALHRYLDNCAARGGTRRSAFDRREPTTTVLVTSGSGSESLVQSTMTSAYGLFSNNQQHQQANEKETKKVTQEKDAREEDHATEGGRMSNG